MGYESGILSVMRNLKKDTIRIPTKKEWLIIIILLVSFLVYQGYGVKKETTEYPALNKFKTNLSGAVIACNSAFTGRGSYVIELQNKVKFKISPGSYNYSYNMASLSSNISTGDSIVFNHTSQEIYLYKVAENYKEYYFIYLKSLNENLLHKIIVP